MSIKLTKVNTIADIVSHIGRIEVTRFCKETCGLGVTMVDMANNSRVACIAKECPLKAHTNISVDNARTCDMMEILGCNRVGLEEFFARDES